MTSKIEYNYFKNYESFMNFIKNAESDLIPKEIKISIQRVNSRDGSKAKTVLSKEVFGYDQSLSLNDRDILNELKERVKVRETTPSLATPAQIKVNKYFKSFLEKSPEDPHLKGYISRIRYHRQEDQKRRFADVIHQLVQGQFASFPEAVANIDFRQEIVVTYGKADEKNLKVIYRRLNIKKVF